MSLGATSCSPPLGAIDACPADPRPVAQPRERPRSHGGSYGTSESAAASSALRLAEEATRFPIWRTGILGGPVGILCCVGPAALALGGSSARALPSRGRLTSTIRVHGGSGLADWSHSHCSSGGAWASATSAAGPACADCAGVCWPRSASPWPPTPSSTLRPRGWGRSYERRAQPKSLVRSG